MKDQIQCPECKQELERTDLAWPASMSDVANGFAVFAALDYAMLFLGLMLWFLDSWIGSLISIVILTYLFWKIVILNRSVYTCGGCNKKFTGKDLKPFDWSFYD